MIRGNKLLLFPPVAAIRSCGGGFVRPVNSSHFYTLGKSLAPLHKIKSGMKYNEIVMDLYSAQSWLDWFLKDMVVPLSVCRGSGQKLLNGVNAVIENFQQDTVDGSTELDFVKAYTITTALTEFETVLSAELQTIATYFVSKTGIYDTADLIEHAERIFSESVLTNIPDHALKDVRECGRCLAFNLQTSAGFHILRATEALIREYYKVVVGHPPTLKSRNWGRYIDILKRHGADSRILAALDQIREMHRNPIMHPEDFLSQEEAATLFGVAQGVIVFIAADIEKRKQAGPTLPGLGVIDQRVAAVPKLAAKKKTEQLTGKTGS
jgi:hypothetical protein